MARQVIRITVRRRVNTSSSPTKQCPTCGGTGRVVSRHGDRQVSAK